MSPTPPLVKICGLTRSEDAVTAAAAGASYGGVILVPGSRRHRSPSQAAELLEGTTLRRVGVFMNAAVDEIAAAGTVIPIDIVQLHGEETPPEIRRLRREGPWKIWKAVRPRTADDLERALDCFGAEVDGLLLDGWSADGQGGTGARFPWDVVAERRHLIPPGVELIVAGGLTPENVARVIGLLRPSIVDVSSGVESTPGLKDAELTHAFISAAREAAAPVEVESNG